MTPKLSYHGVCRAPSPQCILIRDLHAPHRVQPTMNHFPQPPPPYRHISLRDYSKAHFLPVCAAHLHHLLVAVAEQQVVHAVHYVVRRPRKGLRTELKSLQALSHTAPDSCQIHSNPSPWTPPTRVFGNSRPSLSVMERWSTQASYRHAAPTPQLLQTASAQPL